MKYFNNIIIAALASLCLLTLATSCGKFLDEAPTSEQPKEYIFEDYLRANRYLSLLYYYMSPDWTGSGKFGGNYGMMESATDMAEYSAEYGVPNTSFNIGNWKNSNAKTETEIWFACYRQIRRAWMFLENADLFINGPEGRKPMMKGEAHFMLAYYYFELLKRYGGVPLVKETMNLESDYMIPRSSVEEIGEFIITELDEAQKLLPDAWDSEDFGRATKAWCMALRSRTTLYLASPLNNPSNDQAKWTRAIEAAKECIDYCESTGLHKLSTDWQNIFMRYTPDLISEIIVFRRVSLYNFNFNSKIINYEQASPGDDFWGNGSNGPSQNLVDRFPVIVFDADSNAVATEPFSWSNPEHVANMYLNRDPRFYYTVLYNDRMWIKRAIGTWRDGAAYGPDRDPKNQLYTKTGYYLRKFWPRECKDKNNPGSSRIFGFYIRLTEMYFNYAEAMNEVYGPDGKGTYGMTAVEAINKTRARLIYPDSETIANNSSDPFYYVKVERDENPDLPVLPKGLPGMPAGMTKDQAREQIRNERVIEFAFEDQYFYDLLRWREGEAHIGGTVYGVDVVKVGENFNYVRTQVEDRTFDPGRMYRYPIPQSEVYKLGIEQNPGW